MVGASWADRALRAIAVVGCVALGCSGGRGSTTAPVASQTWTHPLGNVTVDVSVSQAMRVWVEDKGLGQGEDVPSGPTNPFPDGDTATYIPVPWAMSPRGFGVLLSTTFRTVFHLGDETPSAWRYEAWTSVADSTLFLDPDPKNMLEDLTALTGRPPAIADWVLAPRRRGDPGSGEWDRLRAAHVPTSVIDADTHYFPNGGGEDHAAQQAVTAGS